MLTASPAPKFWSQTSLAEHFILAHKQQELRLYFSHLRPRDLRKEAGIAPTFHRGNQSLQHFSGWNNQNQ